MASGLRSREHNTIHDVALNVTPLQQPHPPVWVAVIRAEAAPFVARQGFPLLGIPYALERLSAVRDMLQAYHRGYCETSHDPGQADVTLAWHTYVADTTEAAIRESRAALQQYTDTRLYATSRGKTFEELYDNGLLIIGDPAYCRQRLEELREFGMTTMLILSNFGGLAHDQVRKSMHLFAKEVVPAFV